MNTEALHALNDLTEAQKAFAAVSGSGDKFDIKFKRTGRIYIYVARDYRCRQYTTTTKALNHRFVQGVLQDIEACGFLTPETPTAG